MQQPARRHDRLLLLLLSLSLTGVSCSTTRRFATGKPTGGAGGDASTLDGSAPQGGSTTIGSTGTEPSPDPQGACDPDVDAHCTCDEMGCLSTLGGICSRQSDCAEGTCAATEAGHSVCCAQACAETEVCAPGGDECTASGACDDDDDRCDGSDYQRCELGRWRTRAACGDLGCSLDQRGCKLSAGETCLDTRECGEGTCQETLGADRVCCTAACGTCRACRASGTSCENREDDDACGSITCPEDTTCRDYSTGVTGPRCIDGSCGSATTLCTFSARNVGQECKDDALCNDEGNCSAPKLGQGQPCSDASQCNSGFCTEGVCCNEDCDDLCETCSDTGQCRMPESDVRCEDVPCSELDTECAQTVTDISSNVCGSKGECASFEACDLEPEGTHCALNGTNDASCDGRGFCHAPSVSCGGEDCVIAGTTTCCASHDDPGALSCTSDCPVPPFSPVGCDENVDCPNGEVCCLLANALQAVVQCRPVDECAVPNTTSVLHFALCDSPAMSPEDRGCIAGTCTYTGFTTLEGWTFCEVQQ